MIFEPQSRPQDLAPFEPHPGMSYTLETTSQIAGISKRTILLYCKSGLITPLVGAPYGNLVFDESCIQAIRRIEVLKKTHGINLTGIKMIFDLLKEVGRLRQEIAQLRAEI